MSRARKRPDRRRPGFTLVEMLVVIAIIGVLVSLTAVAAFRLIGTQQSSNTKSELTRVEGEFLKIYRAEVDKISKETGQQNSFVLTQAGGDSGRAKVIYVKLRLKQTFPQTFNEALNPVPGVLNPDPYYASVLTQAGYNTSNTSATNPQPWESSVLLLLALQRGVEGNGVKPEDLGVSSFVHDFGPTPNGQTVKGLVDGWGNPIAFCRWPVNTTIPGTQVGQLLPKNNNDPVDPSGLLESAAWQQNGQGPGYKWFVSTCHLLGQPPQATTDATSYRIYPLIASPGPDKQLGLNPLTFQSLGNGSDKDNLYPQMATAQ